jgi:hypothetical protein
MSYKRNSLILKGDIIPQMFLLIVLYLWMLFYSLQIPFEEVTVVKLDIILEPALLTIKVTMWSYHTDLLFAINLQKRNKIDNNFNKQLTPSHYSVIILNFRKHVVKLLKST